MRKLLRVALAAFAPPALAGCAVGPDTSYVAPVEREADAQVLGSGVAAFVGLRLSPGSTVALTPTSWDQPNDAVTPVLADTLRRQGFGVVEGEQPAPANAHRVRYLVTSLDSGNLVRVTLDGSSEGARFFARDTAGGLQAGGPYTVTQAEAAR